VACAYGGALGVPALFPRALFPELAGLRGDRGAQPLLASHADSAIALPFPAGALDLDTEADVARGRS
jgi:molybdenum cofactor cytidylyltransferase